MYAFLGNHKVHLADTDEKPKGKHRTEVMPHPDRDDVAEVFADITGARGIWAKHAAAGSKPAWVASDNPDLAKLLSAFYGCQIRKPLPDGEHGEHAGSAFAIACRVRASLAKNKREFGDTQMLRTNAGTDWLSGIMGNTTAAAATFMALTANAAAASASDTTLTGEITTAGGGLIRKGATYAHTGGTSSFTLTATFTANGSDSLPVTVNKLALFNASSSGTMAFEIVVTAATFSASGDACTYTYTITP
jgi:hypothetical protein